MIAAAFYYRNAETLDQVLACALCIAMMFLLEAGRRLGEREHHVLGDSPRPSLGTLDGVVFALLGLLIAFTFSGAMERFDHRRSLITREANAIGSAWQLIEILPKDYQPELRALFQRYLESRFAVYEALPEPNATMMALEKSENLQADTWHLVAAACKSREGQPLANVVLPAVNDMFDVANERTMALMHHTPPPVYLLLCILALGASLLAGHAMTGTKATHWAHRLAFCLVLSATIFLIYDIEYPRSGFIQLNDADIALERLREGMR
jgi:hypothetical protein